jgi:hypothetical protein
MLISPVWSVREGEHLACGRRNDPRDQDSPPQLQAPARTTRGAWMGPAPQLAWMLATSPSAQREPTVAPSCPAWPRTDAGSYHRGVPGLEVLGRLEPGGKIGM